MITEGSIEPLNTGQNYLYQLNEHIDFIKKYRHDSDVNIKEKIDQLAQVEDSLEIYKKKCMELQIENDRLQSKHEQHELFKEEMMQETRTLANCVQVLEEYILETRKAINSYEETNKLYLSEKEKKATEITNLDTRLQRIKLKKEEQVNEIKSQSLSESNQLQQKLADLKIENDGKKTEIKTLLDELKQKNQNINEICAEILKNKTYIDELKIESNNNWRVITDLEANLKEVKAISAASNGKNQTLQNELNSEKLNNQKSLTDLNEQKLQNEILKADLEEKTNNESELKSQIDQFNLKIQTLEQTIKTNNEANEIKNKQQIELFNQNLQESLNELITKHKDHLVKVNDDLISERAGYESQLSVLDNSVVQLKASLAERDATIKSANKQIKKLTDNGKTNNERLENEIINIKKDMDNLNDELMEKSEMIEIFKNTVENQKATIKQNLAEIETYAANHLKQNGTIEDLNEQIKNDTEKHETDLQVIIVQKNNEIDTNNKVFWEKINKLRINEDKLKSMVAVLKEKLTLNNTEILQEIKTTYSQVNKNKENIIRQQAVKRSRATENTELAPMQPPRTNETREESGRRVRLGNRITIVQNKQNEQLDLKFNESFLDTIGNEITQEKPVPQRSKRRNNVLTTQKNNTHIVTSTPIRQINTTIPLSQIKLSAIDKLN